MMVTHSPYKFLRLEKIDMVGKRYSTASDVSSKGENKY